LGTGKKCLKMEHGSLALVSLPGILFGDREEMLQNGHGSLAQSCFEVVEDEVGIGLGHRTCTTKKVLSNF
jgi:hypothetical protein